MKSIISIAILMFSSTLFASEQISPRVITSLAIYKHYAVAKLAQPAENLDGCSHASAENYVAIEFDSVTSKEMYSAIMSARLLETKIGFGVSDCKSWGSTTIPLIYRVNL